MSVLALSILASIFAAVVPSLAASDASPSPGPSASASAAPTSSPNGAIELARGRIDTLLKTGHANPAWFSPSFLAQIPASKVDAIAVSLVSTLGAYRSVEFTPEKFVAHFAKGTDDVLIHLDANNLIDGLLFKPPAMTSSSLDDGLRALRMLRSPTGTLSYVIIEGRSDRAALDASEPLAVGSAFKLAVMAALRDRTSSGALKWDESIPLDPSWKSLPTGVLRTWPAATPLTLATYAAEMISISDNTAADALIRIVGADALRPYAFRDRPMPTTREVFTLRAPSNAELRSQYLAATTETARVSILRRVDALPPSPSDVLPTTPDLAIEWHDSVRELCGLIDRVSDLPLMSINPGVADPLAFRRVAYKGGSDLGVINLTTSVTTQRGTAACFSATLDDTTTPIDESAFEAAYGTVLTRIARD